MSQEIRHKRLLVLGVVAPVVASPVDSSETSSLRRSAQFFSKLTGTNDLAFPLTDHRA
jgi:hypothetical protein